MEDIDMVMEETRNRTQKQKIELEMDS